MTSFAHLRDATLEDWLEIEAVERSIQKERNAGDGLLRLLRMQRDDPKDGWPINVYDHCLQSATLAYQAGADEELVFCALFHDAAELISLHKHAEDLARLLEPYVSPERSWMIAHHDSFQNQHAVNHPFRDQHDFERFRGHPAFEMTIDFCAKFDAPAFQSQFQAMPLEAFEPLVDRICRAHLPRPGGA